MNSIITNISTKVITELQKSSVKSIEMLDCIICGVITNENVSFENEASYIRVISFIKREILVLNQDLYRSIYPESNFK